MNKLESALLDIAAYLDRQHIPYMVIGGMANAVWGEPRATLDIDITLWVHDNTINPVTEHLARHFKILPENPQSFIRETRVLPVETKDRVRIDLIFGLLPYEEQAILRAKTIPISGSNIRFCTVEDLILHKIISTRPKDIQDIKQIVIKRKHELDLNYLEPKIRELATSLERPEIASLWETSFSGE